MVATRGLGVGGIRLLLFRAQTRNKEYISHRDLRHGIMNTKIVLELCNVTNIYTTTLAIVLQHISVSK